jgi:2-polyprenyl-3-methyl-5-hydroxy-6-metoxy-1,4-benzoquinol methylase
MDDPDCDLELLNNTYRQFRMINTLFSNWHILYHFYLKPRMQKKGHTYSLLDIGFGGGDIPIQLAKRARADGFNLDVTGIDVDPRALDYVTTIRVPSNVSFRHASMNDLLNENRTFDFIITNNTIHHLAEKELHALMIDSIKLCRNLILFNDIERGDLAWLFFTAISTLFFRRSFASYDGRLSIQRSYTKGELQKIIPKDWFVKRLFPYRLLLLYEIKQIGKNDEI